MAPLCYRRHRFPPEIIQHAIWLYLRFTLSYRDVEELLAERGLDISYETVRRWVLKFGPAIARRLRRCRPRPSDRWHLDEMVVPIAGRQMYLCCRRSRGRGPRYGSSASARHSGGAAVDVQAAQEARLRAEIAGHRQAAFLRLRLPASATDLRASAGAAPKQSGRKLASGSPATRAQAAAVQVAPICPALPQRSCRGSQHLQPATPPRFPIHIADLPSRSCRTVARCRRSGMTRGEFRLSLLAR
jgi:hypothetical protein